MTRHETEPMAEQVARRAHQRQWAAGLTVNEWGGIDCPDVAVAGEAPYRVLRMVPIDGDWENGAQLYLFTRQLALLSQLDIHAPVTAKDLAALADALIAVRERRLEEAEGEAALEEAVAGQLKRAEEDCSLVELTLKNGDRVHGVVLAARGGDVTLELVDCDELKVAIAKVRGVEVIDG